MITAVVLAAGEGTRMKSKVPKVLHKLCGKSMIAHLLEGLNTLVDLTVVVIGHKGEEVKAEIGQGVVYAIQEKQLGTGHAVAQTLEHIPEKGQVIIACGDTPLLNKEIFKNLLYHHRDWGSVITVLTAELEDPRGYGRIIRDKKGKVTRIIEDRDASPREKEVKEINTGTYCVEAYWLKKEIETIASKNNTGEYYLTDLVEILARQEHNVSGYKIEDFNLARGINDRVQLARAEEIMRKRINKGLMEEGVTMIDPSSTYIDHGVKVGKDTVIYPQTIIQGDSAIGEDCRIGPQSRLVNSSLGDGVLFQNSVITDSTVDDGASIGPFAHIRPESQIGGDTRVGNFVEIKKSQIGSKSKVPHLSYVGDTTIGKKANLGAGTIIVNYDGVNKHQTVIEDEAFIGCNSNLIAPVSIGKAAIVGAGSTINQDVPEEALALARTPQINNLKAAKRLRALLKTSKNPK